MCKVVGYGVLALAVLMFYPAPCKCRGGVLGVAWLLGCDTNRCSMNVFVGAGDGGGGCGVCVCGVGCPAPRYPLPPTPLKFCSPWIDYRMSV